ncbi:MAG: hypothetical protein CMM49_01300 [Rhodospirillaceae bacterium]|nr:hypothetical protein [Rhodospirillaceae bacterium]|tara:strand:- start:3594 stop:4271 length:678 start_codon:yes stop_codon:yes gene_type:complete
MIMQDLFTQKMIFFRKKLGFSSKITFIFIFLIIILPNVCLGKTDNNQNKPIRIERFLNISEIINLENIFWDMSVDKIIKNIKSSKYNMSDGFKIGYCYFRYSINIKIKNEPWELWLCENPENGKLYGISIEKGFNGVFFEKNKSKSNLFSNFLNNLKNIYGPPEKVWKECHNTRWNFTEQYSWYFAKTTISFVIRDIPLKQMAIHYHKPTGIKDFGPGICSAQPE